MPSSSLIDPASTASITAGLGEFSIDESIRGEDVMLFEVSFHTEQKRSFLYFAMNMNYCSLKYNKVLRLQQIYNFIVLIWEVTSMHAKKVQSWKFFITSFIAMN